MRELSAAAGIGNAEHLARSGRVSVTDLILARAALEPVAAELAATARTEADLAMLRHVHDRFAGADAMEAANVDLDFHTAIMVASHNLVLQVMFAAIRPLAHAMMARSLSDPRVVGADLHGVLVERIAAGDAAGARAAMVQHIEAARMFYGSDLDRSLAEVLQARADVEPGFAAILRELTTDHAALHPRPDPKTPVTAPAPPRS